MKRKVILVTLLICCVLLAIGCASPGAPSSAAPVPASSSEAPASSASQSPASVPSQASGVYQKITAQEARKIMQETDDYILLDVRTQEEYDEAHIEGAILLPDYEIEEKAGERLPDKNAMILVYCRTGRRSAASANKLLEMGYTQVIDFGGIVDWPYETVSTKK
jgi:rhodanese-related sulfurtransferase